MIITERLNEIERLILTECACPILTAYIIELNDSFNDYDRQKLKKFIPLLVGTRNTDAVQIARKRLIMWRNVVAIYPVILDSLKFYDYADTLRKIPNTFEGMEEAKEFLDEKSSEIRKIAYSDTDDYDNAYAYANAHAEAYADPDHYANYYNAFKRNGSGIIVVALNTLKMAIEIT